MNKARRRELDAIHSTLMSAYEALEYVKDDEQYAYDNLPESLQESDRGKQMAEIAEELDEIYSELDDLMDRIYRIVEGDN